jgi:hypothetical protein
MISGDGELAGVGTFNGPSALGQLIAGDGALEACLVSQVQRYAIGRTLQSDDADLTARLEQGLAAGHNRYDALLLALVTSDAFSHRLSE